MATPTSEAPNRPLSPHLGIYRWQWTMALSIFHRATGLVLAVGTVLLVYWLWSASGGPETYARAQALIGSWFGRICLFGWTVALFYHLFNGIRHLAWDAGKGFELRTAFVSGMAVVAATITASVATWVIGYMVK